MNSISQLTNNDCDKTPSIDNIYKLLLKLADDNTRMRDELSMINNKLEKKKNKSRTRYNRVQEKHDIKDFSINVNDNCIKMILISEMDDISSSNVISFDFEKFLDFSKSFINTKNGKTFSLDEYTKTDDYATIENKKWSIVRN